MARARRGGFSRDRLQFSTRGAHEAFALQRAAISRLEDGICTCDRFHRFQQPETLTSVQGTACVGPEVTICPRSPTRRRHMLERLRKGKDEGFTLIELL